MGISWCGGGLLGVTVLFVLSGYLATAGLMREMGSTGAIDLGSYWKRRFWRLMPQVVAFLLVTACLLTATNHLLLTKLRQDLLPALLMVLNWSKIIRQESYFAAAEAPSPLTHFWSLAIEAQFFLVWPPILYLLLRRRTRRRNLCLGLLVAIGASALAMALLYTPGQDPSRSYYGTDTRAFSLLIGALLAVEVPFGRTSSRPLGRYSGGSQLAIQVASVATPAALVVMMVVTDGFSNFSYYGGTLLCSVVAAIALASLLVPDTVASRILSWGPLAWVGSRSYAIYLWHYPIVELLNPRNSTVPKTWWQVLLQLALVFAVAELSYRLVEQPWRHGLSGVRPQVAALLGRGPREDKRAPSPAKGQARSGGTRANTPQRLLAARVGAAAFLAVALTGVVGLVAVPDEGADAGDAPRVMQASLKKPLVDGVYDVILVGDSVSLGAKDQFSAAFPHGQMDSKVSRQPSDALSVLQTYLDQGVVGDTVIFSVGTNGPLTEDFMDSAHDAVGDRQVWFVNVRTPGGVTEKSNAAIDAAVEKYDNFHEIDWYDASAGHDEYFWDDGTHLRPEGAQAFVDLIVSTTGYEVPTEENTHYAVTFVGDKTAMSAADVLAAAFPNGLVDTAERPLPDTRQALKTYLDTGLVGDAIVVVPGSTDPLAREDLEGVVADAGEGHHVWLVTGRSAAPYCEEGNRLIAEVAAEHDNVDVIDWYAASAGHDDYLSEDGVTLTEAGAQAYAQMIKDAVGDVSAEEGDAQAEEGDAASDGAATSEETGASAAA